MKLLKLAATLVILAGFSLVSPAQHHHSSAETPADLSSENPKLIDEFGKLSHCDLTGRYDTFFAELAQNESSQGYVIFYQGTDALPANYGNSPDQRMFLNHMGFRNFPAARVTVIDGGFRKEGATQLWIVPPGAVPPSPTDTLPAPEIPTKETFLFDRSYLNLEEEDYYESEYLLPAVKAQREAERREQEEEYSREQLVNGEVPDEPESETPESNESVEDAGVIEEATQEEIEAAKFSWVSGSFGKQLSEREDSRGVVIFYADDEELDINKIRRLIEEGVDRLNKEAKVKENRITVVFGGYRNITNVEFWIVPKNGEEPKPTPEERPVEEEETEESAY